MGVALCLLALFEILVIVKSYKIVISDCHLSAGRIFEGQMNPYEDFAFDRELCELIAYFSSGIYGDSMGEPTPVELFINGDFFDFLNVPVQGEFEDAVTEALSLFKLEQMLKAHRSVMVALKRFASLPAKTITYLIGNHDADLFFPSVKERIVREWDPEGQYPSQKVCLITDRDRVRWPGGVEIHHGNQFEAVHLLNFQRPLLFPPEGPPVLNLPWGSFYVLKIVNRLKGERDFIDKVRPMKLFVLLGLLVDTVFTFKLLVFSLFYFFKTRFISSPKRRASWRVTWKILHQESGLMSDLEKEARLFLDQDSEVKTLILGHTHYPLHKVYPDGKQYLNTGTWTKMIHLDIRSLGQAYCLSFALLTFEDGQVHCELRRWLGAHEPHQEFRM